MVKKHWAIQTVNPGPRSWKAYTGLLYVQACGRKKSNIIDCRAALFVVKHQVNPDWYCSDCAKAARLALAAESAPKPTIHNKAGACVVRPELGQLVRERPNCGEKRTDSARYNELRKLVEAWQSHTVESSQSLADWRHR